MSHSLHKILVIQTASIGDVILATPVVEGLHERYPDAKIDFLLKKGIEGVFSGHPFLNKIWIWDKNQHKNRNLHALVQAVRNERYDLVVNIQRFFSTGLLTVFSRAKVKAGFDKNPFSLAFDHKVAHVIGTKDNPIHETARNLSLIHDFAPHANAGIKLYPSKADFLAVSHLKSDPYICMAPASLWFTKQYPEQQWLELIKQLGGKTRIYLLGSNADKALCDRLAEASGLHDIKSLAGELSFLQSAALIKNASMNYVNDSTPMHLASAVNAPVAAIFCSTVPYFGFGPLSEKSYVIETQENLSCRPCGLHGKKSCPEEHFNCAKTIKPEQLLYFH
ncbi:MAG: glycosyltransferase family 9 protein [Bacteroidales bacterium]|nr:glycosyltransferase family 9 protein [Bacteroidales bacterium]